MCSIERENFHLEQSRYDQDSYWGRVRTHLDLYNPLNIFRSPSTLQEARCLYLKHRCGEPLPSEISEEDLWKAKALYESAYSPHAGLQIPFLARPGTQLPVHALLAGGMMAYYSSAVGVVLWQSLNQAYNTYIHATCTSGDEEFTDKQLVASCVLATGTAVGTALGLDHFLRCSSRLVRRFVPLAAVAAAHAVSVPLLRAQMLKNGAPIYDDCNVKLGYSKMAAQAGIGGVVVNKTVFAIPPMVLTPLVMHHFVEARGTICRYPWLNLPIHAGLAFLFLTLVSPLACAWYDRKGLIAFRHLEPELQGFLCKKFYERPPKYVYYDRSLY